MAGLVLVLGLSAAGLPQEVEFPLVQSLAYFPYSQNSQVKQGDFALDAQFFYSNVFMFNHYRTIINDFEVLSGTAGLRYGLSEKYGLNLELYLRWSTIFGGTLDKFIENFHSTFDLPDDGRPEYPRNSVHYWYKDSFSYTGNRGALSPVILALLGNIYTARDFSFKGRVSFGIPLSNTAGFSSGKIFLNTGLIFNYKKKNFFLDFSNYIASIQTPGRLAGESFRKQIFFSRLEINLSRFITGFIYRSSAFREDDVAHSAYQVYLGYKITKYLDLILLEDFKPYDTSPDVS
ncbi:MAG: DUF3187 family protein, partial [bacterium]|nr:DUF3187 family protein [bacterium]